MKRSLGEIAKKRIISEMIAPATLVIEDVESAAAKKSSSASGGIVMVLDAHTLRIISSACRRQDLTDAGVLFIEQIEKQRQPFPDLDVVYFVTPASVDLIVKDHQASPPPYRYTHVYLSSGKANSDSILSKLASNAQFVSRCKSLTEMNLDFVCFEPRVFHSDAPEAIKFLKVGADNSPALQSHISALSSLFASLKEKPVIKYMSPETSVSKSNLSQRIGLGLRRELDELSKNVPAIKPSSSHASVVLILDRSVDTSGLFIHDLHYQGLAADILDGEDGLEWPLGVACSTTTSVVPSFEFEATTGKGKEKRKVLLADQDPLWVRFRHEHFRVAADGISREVSELVKSSELAKISIQGSSGKDPLELLRSIPEYQDQLSRLSVHLELSKKLIEVFEKIYLMEVARVEQELATGVDDEGREISCPKILQSIISLCNDARVGPDEKLRLVLLYLSQVEDVSEETFKDLVKKWAKLTGHHEAAVMNFLQLSIHQPSPPGLQHQPDGVMTAGVVRQNVVTLKSGLSLISTRGNKIKKNKTLAKESKFVHCRFKSDLTEVVEQTLLNQLDNTLFPTVSGTGTSALFTSSVSSSASSSQPGAPAISKAAMWGGQSAAAELEPHSFGKEKLVVFVVGGITLGECREIAKLESQYGVEIIIGGSCILTPNRLLEILLL